MDIFNSKSSTGKGLEGMDGMGMAPRGKSLKLVEGGFRKTIASDVFFGVVAENRCPAVDLRVLRGDVFSDVNASFG